MGLSCLESVQKGIQSGHYSRGRYAPEMEVAVHHFHQLIEKHDSFENIL